MLCNQLFGSSRNINTNASFSIGLLNLPHPLYPPLLDMDIYSYHEGEQLLLKGLRPFKLPLINSLNYK